MNEYVVHIRDAVIDLFNNVVERAKTKNPIPGLRTGYDHLDWMIGGLQPGELVIIGGKPGVGKSAFVTSIVNNIITREQVSEKSRTIITYFDLETSARRLSRRMMGQRAGIHLDKLESGSFVEEEFMRLTTEAATLAQARFQIVDKRHMKPSQIEAVLRDVDTAYEQAAGEPGMTAREDDGAAAETPLSAGRSLVILDSLQEIVPDQRGQNRDEEMCWNVSALKTLARSFDCAIVAISRLNRRWDSRPDPAPQLQDLRYSGSIEDVADVVLLLETLSPIEHSPRKQHCVLRVAKNRNGRRGRIELDFDQELGIFASPDDSMMRG